MSYEKISKNLSITSENDTTAVIKTGTSFETISRFEAIKLRNYLNRFINGEYEEENNEDTDVLSKL